MVLDQFTEGQGLTASFCLFPASSFSAIPLGVIAQVREDSTFAHKTECGSSVCHTLGRSIPFSLLVFGPVPSPAFFHAVVRDVGPVGSAPDDKPEGPAADDKPEGPEAHDKLEGPAPDDKLEGPGADDKFDRLDKLCALMPVAVVGDTVEPARVTVVSFFFRTCT